MKKSGWFSLLLVVMVFNFGCDKISIKIGDNAKESKSERSAGNQKIIYTTDDWRYRGESYACSSQCLKNDSYIKHEPINDYLQKGWRVVSSTPRQKKIDDNCICLGTEYVIEQ